MPANSIPSLSEILEDQLYLGNLSAALSAEQRKKYSITHILSVCPEYPSTDSGQDHLNISVEDSEYEDLLIHLPETCKFIEHAIEQGGKVLVHCVMGISRSPAVVAAYCEQLEDELIHYKLMLTPIHSNEDKGFDGTRSHHVCQTEDEERPQVHLNYGFAKQLDTFRKCGFHPSLENTVYRSWKRRNEQDVTAFLNHLVDTVTIIPDKLLLNSEFPSDPEKTWSLLMDLGVTHLLSITPAEISATAGSIAHHHHINIDSRSPDALLFALPDICAYIDRAIKNGGLVLVHSMIESRACTGVCAYLMSASHHTIAEAFGAISKALPLFNPTRNFIHNLEVFEECRYAPSSSIIKDEPAPESPEKDITTRDRLNSTGDELFDEKRFDLDKIGQALNTIQNPSQSVISVR